MMFWFDHANGWGYALMIVSMLAFWALVMVGVMFLIGQPHPPAPG